MTSNGLPIYWFQYNHSMAAADLIHDARLGARLGQADLARRSGTSQPALSTYENGRVSPRLDVAERVVQAAGYELAITPRVEFTMHLTKRGRPFFVPNGLPQQPPHRALARVEFPPTVFWSPAGKVFDLSDRGTRISAYKVLLQEGRPDDMLASLDGTLLIEMWDDLFIPRDIRALWAPVITAARER